MIQASWVWVAWVDRAISGRATFSDDMAATTVARATHTTAVTAPLRTAPAAGDFGGRYHGDHLRLLTPAELSSRTTLHIYRTTVKSLV